MNVNHKKEVKMNLKHVRQNKKMTQKKLALEIGVDQSTVSKWEREAAQPNLNMCFKIAQVLECSIDELVKEGK